MLYHKYIISILTVLNLLRYLNYLTVIYNKPYFKETISSLVTKILLHIINILLAISSMPCVISVYKITLSVNTEEWTIHTVHSFSIMALVNNDEMLNSCNQFTTTHRRWPSIHYVMFSLQTTPAWYTNFLCNQHLVTVSTYNTHEILELTIKMFKQTKLNNHTQIKPDNFDHIRPWIYLHFTHTLMW